MAALLVGIAIMSIMLSMAMPVWRHTMQREREAELIWRGEQYARAIGLYQRRFAGAFPANVEVLVEQRFLRRPYTDPMTDGGEFQVLYATSGAGGQPAPPSAGTEGGVGVVGVVSRSTEASIRIYHGRQRYSEWQFVHVAVAQGPDQASPGQGVPGAAMPGGPADRGELPDPDDGLQPGGTAPP